MSDWLKYRIVINNLLLKNIQKFGKEQCCLWTKASNQRVEKIIRECSLTNLFSLIIYDKKNTLINSLIKIKNIIKTKEVIIYENNHNFFKKHKFKIKDKIKNRFFNVRGYYVNLDKIFLNDF